MYYDSCDIPTRLAKALYQLQVLPDCESAADQIKQRLYEIFENVEEKKGVKKLGSLLYYSNGLIEMKDYYNGYGSKETIYLEGLPFNSISGAKKSKAKGYKFNIAWLTDYAPESIVDIMRFINSNGKVQKKYFDYTEYIDRNGEFYYRRRTSEVWHITFVDFIKGLIQFSIAGTDQYHLNISAMKHIFEQFKEYFLPLYKAGNIYIKSKYDDIYDNDFYFNFIEDFDGLEGFVADIIKYNIESNAIRRDDGTYSKLYYGRNVIDRENYLSNIIINTAMIGTQTMGFEYDKFTSKSEFTKPKMLRKLLQKSNANERLIIDNYVKVESYKDLKSNQILLDNSYVCEFGNCDKISNYDALNTITNCSNCYYRTCTGIDSNGNVVKTCTIDEEQEKKISMEYADYLSKICLNIHNMFGSLPDCDYKKMLIKKGFYDPKVDFSKFTEDLSDVDIESKYI